MLTQVTYQNVVCICWQSLEMYWAACKEDFRLWKDFTALVSKYVKLDFIPATIFEASGCRCPWYSTCHTDQPVSFWTSLASREAGAVSVGTCEATGWGLCSLLGGGSRLLRSSTRVALTSPKSIASHLQSPERRSVLGDSRKCTVVAYSCVPWRFSCRSQPHCSISKVFQEHLNNHSV